MVFRICVWHLALCLYLATITVISKKVRQDESRLDVLKRLNENTVLVVNDWAMKFLPQLYRESQQDCFVKRGISWHISVVFRRVRGELQSQSFVHIIQQCNQDSTCIILIMQHVLKTLKAEHPEITTAFYAKITRVVTTVQTPFLHVLSSGSPLEFKYHVWTCDLTDRNRFAIETTCSSLTSSGNFDKSGRRKT